MKKVLSLLVLILFMTTLPIGVLADEQKGKIPNYVEDAQSNNGGESIRTIVDDAEKLDLSPTQRKILKRDSVISNAPTGTINSDGVKGQ